MARGNPLHAASYLAECLDAQAWLAPRPKWKLVVALGRTFHFNREIS